MNLHNLLNTGIETDVHMVDTQEIVTPGLQRSTCAGLKKRASRPLNVVFVTIAEDRTRFLLLPVGCPLFRRVRGLASSQRSPTAILLLRNRRRVAGGRKFCFSLSPLTGVFTPSSAQSPVCPPPVRPYSTYYRAHPYLFRPTCSSR